MLTYEQVLKMANALGNDAIVFNYKGHISVDFNDFEGFDDDWSEIMRDYDDVNAVEKFELILRLTANKVDEDFYTTYYFDDFVVQIGYTSYDI